MTGSDKIPGKSCICEHTAPGKVGARYYKRETTLRVTPDQKVKQKECCNALRRGLFKPEEHVTIILDDETYFRLKDDKQYHNRGNYSEE